MKNSYSYFLLQICFLPKPSFGEFSLLRQQIRIPFQHVSDLCVGSQNTLSKYDEAIQKQDGRWVRNSHRLCYEKSSSFVSPTRSASTLNIAQNFVHAYSGKIKQSRQSFQGIAAKTFKWFQFPKVSRETIQNFALILRYSLLGLICVELIHGVFDLSQEIFSALQYSSDDEDNFRTDSKKALSKNSVKKLIAGLQKGNNECPTLPSAKTPAWMITLAYELHKCNELSLVEVERILLQLTNAEVKLLQACLFPFEKKKDFAEIGGLFNAKVIIGQSLMSYSSGLRTKRKSSTNNSSQYGEMISRWHGHQNMILWGPPGCGKSLLIRAIAKHSGVPTLVLSLNLMRDHYRVGTFFSLVSKLGSCVVVLDDLDVLFGNEDRGIVTELRSELMQWWDDIHSFSTRYPSKCVFMVAATSHPWNVDVAAYRRLPNRIYIGLPNSEDRYDLLKKFSMASPPIEESVLQYLVSLTEGYIPLDIYQVLVHACQNGPLARQDATLTIDDVYLALSAVSPTRFPTQYIQQLQNFITLNIASPKSSILESQTEQPSFFPNVQEYLSPHVIQSFPFSENGYCWETTVGNFYQFRIPIDSEVLAAIQTILLYNFEWSMSDSWDSSEEEDDDH